MSPRPSSKKTKALIGRATAKPKRTVAKSTRQSRTPPEGLAFVNGKIMDLAKATVPLNDRGYLLGDGVFETLRTAGGRVFRLADHSSRIKAGLRAIWLEEAVAEDFELAVAALVKAAKPVFGPDLYLRVNISTGPMDDVAGLDRGVITTGLVKRFKPYPMQYYANGVHLIVSKQRKDSRSPLATVKSLSFLPYVAARREAHTATVHDAILLNEHDRVAEATTSNVFARVGTTIHAPGAAEGAVPGVTRGVLLDLARKAGYEIVETLDLATLKGAEEAWLTNTTGGVVPMTRFQDRKIGDGKKGPATTKLSHAFEAVLRGK